MKIAQLLESAGISYTTPNASREWGEAQRYPELDAIGIEGFKKLLNSGKVTSWDSLGEVNNVDLEVSQLAPAKVKRAQSAIKAKSVELPIVGKWPDGFLELIAGNTRVAALLHHKISPSVLVIDIPAD